MECSGALSIRSGSLPVIVERSTPVPKVKDFHHRVCDCDITKGEFDHEGLPKILGEAPVEEEQADLGAPLHGTHALLDKQDSLGSPGPYRDLVRRQIDRVSRVDEVRRHIQVNVEKDDKNSV
jgi:hypothetical protein